MKPLIIKYARLVQIAFVCVVLSSCSFQKPTPVPANNSPSIAALDIPEEAVAYPDDWPVDLLFPDNFILVEANSGASIGGLQQGWTAMYRFKGNVDESKETLNQYFTKNTWDILISENQEAGGYMLLVENEEMEGFTVIEVDPDSDRKSLIMITFFR